MFISGEEPKCLTRNTVGPWPLGHSYTDDARVFTERRTTNKTTLCLCKWKQHSQATETQIKVSSCVTDAEMGVVSTSSGVC